MLHKWLILTYCLIARIIKRIDSDECSKGLGGCRLCMTSPRNFSVKNYTEIFYILYKRNFSSFQCKMSLDRSTSTGEVDGLSLILVDFYVSALTPCHHCSEAALQLPENIDLFALCCKRECIQKFPDWPSGARTANGTGLCH
jgi:hypothetical protein